MFSSRSSLAQQGPKACWLPRPSSHNALVTPTEFVKQQFQLTQRLKQMQQQQVKFIESIYIFTTYQK